MGEFDRDPEGPDDAGRDCPAEGGEVRAQEVERLFRDHNEALVRYLTLRLHSRQEAREVAQEAYVRLLQLERSDVSSFLRAYLFRIAGNLAIDRLRRRATELRAHEAELFSGLFERPPEPEAVALERERVEQVRGILQELPEAVREAFLLFRTQEMDQATIARRLGITDRMVRNHITRALLYCRLRLDGLAPAEVASRLKGPTLR
ncbi:MAG TPA: sigma-70 family RNA polymerase sigma factor [Steroidobacteraceae bacterium]|nr:sigma-70 family RNA polymerase sigma factor [Steroidobacteraceae bacterium]